MNVERVKPIPLPPPLEDVVITLTFAEARALKLMLLSAFWEGADVLKRGGVDEPRRNKAVEVAKRLYDSLGNKQVYTLD